MTKIYGIKNCDTMKKAFKWLEAHQIPYEFHDYRKDGLSETMLQNWLSQVDYQQLLNKRSTSWRKLSDEDKQDIDQAKAIKLLLANEAMIKRPLLEYNGQIYLGFSEKNYQKIFNTEL